MFIDAAIVLLSLASFLISTYFTAIAYRWVDPSASYMPGFCRMGEKTCASVIFTPRARVFGIPNSLLGQIFYLVLMLATASGLLWSQLYWPVLAASALTVLLGMYLTWSLLFWTKIPCRLCFTSHAINAAIFVLLVSGAGRAG